MWEAFHCGQFTKWAGEKITLKCAIEATKTKCANKIRDIKLEHEEKYARLQSALPIMGRKLDELSGAARTVVTARKDNKILRRMLTLRGVESSDLERKLRSLVKEKFQLNADLRSEGQKNSELNAALAEYEEECKASLAKYEVEHKAHQELKAKSLVAVSSYDEQVAKCNDEKAEKELYQKLCEDERAQYLAGKQQLEARLMAATALAATETTAREKAELEHRGHVNSLLDESSRLKMEAKNHETLRTQIQAKSDGALKQCQSALKLALGHNTQLQGKLNDANKRCKASDKQLENAKSKAESLKGQLAETTKEQELAVEERDRLRNKLKTIFGVAAE